MGSAEDAAGCCPYTSHTDWRRGHPPGDCGGQGASLHDQIIAATHFTGRKHVSAGGPMTKAALDRQLESGRPVLMQVGPHNQATHVVYLRGCGDGIYYYWDPEWGTPHNLKVYPAGSDKRSYAELLSYTYPSGYVMNWFDTIYAE